MTVKQIVIAHLKSIGADGLYAEECGCGLDDFMPCGGDRDVSTCKPAKAHKCDGSCNGCLADEAHPIEATCYRPMETTKGDTP